MTTLHIEKMNCQHCVRRVRNAIEHLPEVESVVIDLKKARAVVRWKGEKIPTDELLRTLEAAGYPSRPIEAD